MPIFYRGAAVGTWWHKRDARKFGFTPNNPGIEATSDRLMNHIARGTVSSPYVSLTRSYSVAWSYATFASRGGLPTARRPAYVYEIEINNPCPRGLELIDPVKELGKMLPDPLETNSYQHDGLPSFLLGVVDSSMVHHLHAPILHPPPGGGTSRPALLSLQLETLIRAMRDAEILALGTIPTSCIRTRYKVY